MKRILLLVIGAMISLQAGARTLYVDASRPNNNGNGLKTTTAKKTIQAAVNAAKAGDTIVVLAGTYAPITTKNKKIVIKAKSGASKTIIRYSGLKKAESAVVKLGKTWTKRTAYRDGNGNVSYVTESSGSETKGTSTTVSGFTIDGTKRGDGGWDNIFGVSGGTLKSCIVKNVAGNRTVCRSKLINCTLRDNAFLLIEQTTLSRCKIQNNKGNAKYGTSASSTFDNCLLASNDTVPMKGCTFVNCTVAENTSFTMSSSKAWNTIFYGVASSQFASKRKNTLTKCYKGGKPMFKHLEEDVWVTNITSNWVYDSKGPDTIYTNGVKNIYDRELDFITTNKTTYISAGEEGASVDTDPVVYPETTPHPTNSISYLKVETTYDNGKVYHKTTPEVVVDDGVNIMCIKTVMGVYYWLDTEFDKNGIDASAASPTNAMCYFRGTDPEGGGWTVNYNYNRTIKETIQVSLPARGRWNVVEDRVLSNEIPGDYHLLKGSPCIDKGTKAAAAKKLFGSKDLDGKKRIKGKSVDIGCYEY